jgi:hypothetical protein
MSASFYRSNKGRLLFRLRGRIPRTDFWVGLVVVAVMTALAILLHGHRLLGGVVGPLLWDRCRRGDALALLPHGSCRKSACTTSTDRVGMCWCSWPRSFWAPWPHWHIGPAPGRHRPGSTQLLDRGALRHDGMVCGFARGSVGDNRFGPDPLAPEALLAIGSEHLSAQED